MHFSTVEANNQFQSPDQSPSEKPIDVRDAAEELRARGFALCKPDPSEKKPTYRGWSTRSLEADDFRTGDMLGIIGGPLSDGGRPGHALVIIDLDSPDAVRLADEHLPPTTMEEGRPGKRRSHRYYLVPVDTIPGWARSTAEQGAAAAEAATGHPGPFKKAFSDREAGKRVIDFLGTGGQAVCPPSVWASADGSRTELREWEGGEPGEPAAVPFLQLWDAVCRLASACGAKIPPAERNVFTTTATAPPSVYERARLYLAKIPEAVAGNDGHGQLFRAARAMVYEFDLGVDDGLRILTEHYNPRCRPAWSETELRHKVEDADRKPFDKPRGHLRDRPLEGNGRGPATFIGPMPDAPKKGYPAPDEGETWSDPHRLARLFVADNLTASGEETVRQWRDDFHMWDGAAYRCMPDSDMDARLVNHARDVFVADLPGRVDEWNLSKRKGAKPKVYPVTMQTRGNVRLNLGALTNVPDRDHDAPFWIGDAAKLPDPSEVIAAPNGLFTLDAIASGGGRFSPPTPKFFSPCALPFPVSPDPAFPEVWHRCLRDWFSGDAPSILGLQEAMGYLLSATTCAQKIIMLVGPKRSGKGTVTNVLTELVGSGNVASTTFAALGESFGLENLLGKRMAIIPDARLSGRTDTAAVAERLLSVSGEDQQSVNRKNRPRITTKLRTRFLIGTNELPHLPDSSGALPGRFVILLMPNSFFNREDTGLMDKLRAEYPGILKWAAQGYVRLRCQDYRFTPNAAAASHHRELEDLSSPVRAFVRECCRVGPDCEVPRAELFTAWGDWCKSRGMQATADNVFGCDLKSAVPQIRTTQTRNEGCRYRVYKGIRLRPRLDWGDEG